MTFTHSRLLTLTAATLLVVASASACGKSPAPSPAGSAASTASSATSVAEPTSSSPAMGASSTVVFEVTGSGKALTIDLVPSGPDRLYDVPLPWTDTITITPDVKQLQVVVVGTSSPGPGCKITLDGAVVAEQPDGGSAHCVFDR